ncbi:galactose mutarotase [Oscillochloris sp. ZM17-4]|uniref:aldose epimerase family protein n=1 Tax=Oscillochloris sp. ZM17-4 TaxID=2866714 RepID=UPI001C734B88|nr:aldose epimerase family protein [Oscillochloris sp. ZM17-4]MBX0326412.1 galactose mutarotase [Oscillochloris sp. ZM17-4]
MPILQRPIGTTRDGIAVERFTLRGDGGVEADILSYGGTLAALRAPDQAGAVGDVVLGFDSLDPYLGFHPYLGSLVGRYANRIAEGRFRLGGRAYALACNNGPNHLHGGPGGFHRQVWGAQALDDGPHPALRLHYLSRDGEEGYPGNLDVTVTYTLAGGELWIDYLATTDQETVVNLTNHAYFNLSGGGDILGHVLEIPAARFVPVGPTLIPTGELRPVAGTPLDFRAPAAVGARIGADDEQLRSAGGYDHTWVIDKPPGELGLAARATDPASGRALEVLTTEPGVQFYAGNMIEGGLVGRGGQTYIRHSGLCLEAQHFPDSPNQPAFPSTALRPGDTYRQTTIYRLGLVR